MNQDPVRARLDEMWSDTEADYVSTSELQCCSDALRAVLDLCEPEDPEAWSAGELALVDLIRRAIAEKLGVE